MYSSIYVYRAEMAPKKSVATVELSCELLMTSSGCINVDDYLIPTTYV
jgi:hypothetical protein